MRMAVRGDECGKLPKTPSDALVEEVLVRVSGNPNPDRNPNLTLTPVALD